MASDELTVFAVVDSHHCHGDGFTDIDGDIVVELYVSEQTARQHASRGPHLSVRKWKPRASLRPF